MCTTRKTGPRWQLFWPVGLSQLYRRPLSLLLGVPCFTSVLGISNCCTPIAWTPFFPASHTSSISVTLSQLFQKAVHFLSVLRVKLVHCMSWKVYPLTSLPWWQIWRVKTMPFILLYLSFIDDSYMEDWTKDLGNTGK